MEYFNEHFRPGTDLRRSAEKTIHVLRIKAAMKKIAEGIYHAISTSRKPLTSTRQEYRDKLEHYTFDIFEIFPPDSVEKIYRLI